MMKKPLPQRLHPFPAACRYREAGQSRRSIYVLQPGRILQIGLVDDHQGLNPFFLRDGDHFVQDEGAWRRFGDGGHQYEVIQIRYRRTHQNVAPFQHLLQGPLFPILQGNPHPIPGHRRKPLLAKDSSGPAFIYRIGGFYIIEAADALYDDSLYRFAHTFRPLIVSQAPAVRRSSLSWRRLWWQRSSSWCS